MTAAVLPFKGKSLPRFERMPAKQKADTRALRDARLIREAKDDDNWQAALLLSLLKVLSADQRRTLETMLSLRVITGRANKEVEQALALVRFQSGSAEHREQVTDMLRRMGAFE